MKLFEIPAIEVVEFAMEDVITTSVVTGGGEEDELPGDLG